MDHHTSSHSPEKDAERLRRRIDKMAASGRISSAEAVRVRSAIDSGDDIDDAVLDIRLRHARAFVADKVRSGRMTKDEADHFVQRVANRETPADIRNSRRR